MAEAPVMNMVVDFPTSTDFEKKHTPFITLEQGEGMTLVTVEVGHEVAHPNGTDHYITMIELYAGDAPIARLDLSPVMTHPRLTVPVSLPAGTTLRAVEHCNLHGFWSFEVAV